jgi:hypothetical protein
MLVQIYNIYKNESAKLDKRLKESRIGTDGRIDFEEGARDRNPR